MQSVMKNQISSIVAAAVLLLATSCGLSDRQKFSHQFGKGIPNELLAFYLGFFPEYRDALEHSIIKGFRGKFDCQPECPKVDIWQYQFKGKDGTIITDTKPIATREENWKVPFEARIIALTLFGNQQRYLHGLRDYIDTAKNIKEINGITEFPWGYETFTFRVYVARRNPVSAMPELERATSQEFIDELLAQGFEVAYVDNGLKTVGLDSTFWRLMIAAEQMPPGKRIRYIVRDVDWLLSAPEAFSLGEWINSGKKYHRMHILPICVGPLTAGTFGGWHEGIATEFAGLKVAIENYPYRLFYGDDEAFTRDMMWPRMKFSGDVLTHHFDRDIENAFANPYEGSCEEPTSLFCEQMNPSSNCQDSILPSSMTFDAAASRLGNTVDLLKRNSSMSRLPLQTEAGRNAVIGFGPQPNFR